MGQFYIRKNSGNSGDTGAADKKQRPRFVSYDDEQNEALRNGLIDARTSEEMQSRLEEEETKQLFRRCVGALSRREWLLFEMHYVRAMRAKEIAAELDEDVSAVGYDVNALKAKVRGRLLSFYRNERRR